MPLWTLPAEGPGTRTRRRANRRRCLTSHGTRRRAPAARRRNRREQGWPRRSRPFAASCHLPHWLWSPPYGEGARNEPGGGRSPPAAPHWHVVLVLTHHLRRLALVGRLPAGDVENRRLTADVVLDAHVVVLARRVEDASG